ncbi:hypothetical protein [Mycobacterium sp. 1164985.4]|uniref:hypothetical protein n=1 Tax=Mycobacterium sp. 1164985.4 TaxID=1834069 RepID=UPI0007FFAFDB|nr:hypothetical protein [Mycobacterium sp. 1164985.4]OBK81712.1 hypothetical protein A5650_25135 [Mycobacterium sp. 1164985.4]
MKSHLPRVAGALAVVIAMLMLTAPCVAAQPDDPEERGGALVDSPTLQLSDLGSSNTITFNVNRDVSSSGVGFPVPQGLAPVALNATIELPTNLRVGNLSVTQGDRTISRLALPTNDQAQMVIPLAGAQVFNNWVEFTLTMTALPLEGYCWDPLAPIRLVNSSVTFAGMESIPPTVAAFLPPVLSRLTIAVPTPPSQPESNAAVQLAAATAVRYSGQNPDVVIVPLPEGAITLPNPSVPLERQVIIKEGPDKGVSLQRGAGVGALLISGQGDELTNQTRLLSDDSLQYALSSKAVAGPLATEQELFRDATTLEELEPSGLSSEAMWPQVEIELDQSRFGHSLKGIRLHLIGSHTPLPSDFGGEVLATVGGETVGRWPVEANGTIDHSVSIPDKLLKRSTSLQITVHTTGDPGRCGDYLPMTLKMDGNTEIQAVTADPPVPPGFQSLPQALMPRIQFGIGDDLFGDTTRAAAVAVGLQKMSGVPLITTVTTLKQAIDSNEAAVLISSEGWTDETVALPFDADQGNITVQGVDAKNSSVTVTLDPEVRFGSLQTVFDGKRSLLIATSNAAPAQLDEVLRWLSSERGRWSGLNGRAVISVPGSEPVTVPNPPTDIWAPESSNTDPEAGWLWWVVGGVAVLAAAGALMILLKTRRSVIRSSPDLQGGSRDAQYPD